MVHTHDAVLFNCKAKLIYRIYRNIGGSQDHYVKQILIEKEKKEKKEEERERKPARLKRTNITHFLLCVYE